MIAIDMKAPQITLTWNNREVNFTSFCEYFQKNEMLTDVTLIAQGKTIKAHKLVLCAGSSYLYDILFSNTNANPFIALPEVNFDDLKLIIEFIYTGKLSVNTDQLDSIIKLAELFDVHGFLEALREYRNAPPIYADDLPYDSYESLQSIKKDNSSVMTPRFKDETIIDLENVVPSITECDAVINEFNTKLNMIESFSVKSELAPDAFPASVWQHPTMFLNSLNTLPSLFANESNNRTFLMHSKNDQRLKTETPSVCEDNQPEKHLQFAENANSSGTQTDAYDPLSFESYMNDFISFGPTHLPTDPPIISEQIEQGTHSLTVSRSDPRMFSSQSYNTSMFSPFDPINSDSMLRDTRSMSHEQLSQSYHFISEEQNTDEEKVNNRKLDSGNDDSSSDTRVSPKCFLCEKTFEHADIAQPHCNESNNPIAYPCPWCMNIGLRPVKGIVNSENVNFRTYVCSYCKKFFGSKHILN